MTDKKFGLVMVLVFGMTGAMAFAQSSIKWSVGGGLQTGIVGVGIVNGENKATDIGAGSGFQIVPRFGGFAFIDATCLEASIGFSGGTIEYFHTPYEESTVEYSGSYAAINFGLLGKYPFVFNKWAIYPMLGIDYLMFLSVSVEDEEYDTPSDLSALFFKIGLGSDIFLTEKLYLRGALAFGIGPSNKFAEDRSKIFNVDTTPSICFSFKLAVGFNF